MRLEQVATHRRNRNLVLALAWLLVLGGYFSFEPFVTAAGALIVNGYAWFLMYTDKRLAKGKAGGFPRPAFCSSLFSEEDRGHWRGCCCTATKPGMPPSCFLSHCFVYCKSRWSSGSADNKARTSCATNDARFFFVFP